MEVHPNEWFIMGNAIKMDDLGVPLFQETSKCSGSLLAFKPALTKDCKAL